MEQLKRFIRKYFQSFSFFYSHLKHRVFIVVGLSIVIGILDGFGLSLFLPLLQIVDNPESVEPESLGNLRFLVDFIENSTIPLNLLTVLGFMIFFFFSKGAVQYLAGVYKVTVQQWFIKNLRLKNIHGLNELKYSYFVGTDAGRIQNTLTGEVDRIANAFQNYFFALQYAILVSVYTIFAFTIDSVFAILVTIGGILSDLLYKNLYRYVKSTSRSLTGETNFFQNLVLQHVGNYKYLKATGTLEKFSSKLEKSAVKIEKRNKKIGKLNALLGSAREPILIIVVVTVIYVQINFLGSELGPILISLLFFYRALSYLMQLQIRWSKFLSFSGSMENMASFGRELKVNKESVKANRISIKSIEMLEMDKANFSYGNQKVLNNISLKIEKFETIAFVGESGSGKTTIVNILSGLLPLDSGSYYVNDKNIGDIETESFQQKVGYITQDPVIFNDTIFNNVALWSPETEENKTKFWNAVNEASILDFVNALPNKENTVLDNNGANLSGGQKQRISIARELFKTVELLILDEATSALDSETENIIQKNIDALKGKYTILIVAHRLSTIRNADRIVLMKEGSTTVGTFNELLTKSKYFHKLVELQEI
ncbi:ABC transporter ATP-binding protein [Pontixanthobacter gangjinensis]|uniref:ABC transporter ATP-binding protein n=1 Tax=Christiangramia aestuarii TaxID=1028746 RepID=A0A7M3SWT9_9FLAO|nr:ABC transporter ATP-binding protein [Christiangramia aestuarii]MUP41070.1 ABC transporter ATP-binding protein [Christiangramia aestuarii]